MAWRTASWDGEAWRARAACAQHDPGIFFPVGSSPGALAEARRAKQVCGGCPVRQACLVFAVTTNQEHGIWGGLDEDERREVRRAWRRARRSEGRWAS